MPKRRPNKKDIPIRQGETVTRERRRQNGGVISEIMERDNSGKAYIKRQRACAECVLDYYLSRGKISAPEYEAAMKFRKAYLRAVLRVKVEDNGAGAHGDPEMAMLIIAESERRLRQAYAVLSPSQKTVVISVCGHDDWVGDTYRFETFHRALARLIDLWPIG